MNENGNKNKGHKPLQEDPFEAKVEVDQKENAKKEEKKEILKTES
ncbi:MAG: hypothetical protein AABX51_08350 [Nanoarchaeota archaeon]